MEGTIYTVSELQSTKRRKILNEARSRGAQIRDKDGTGLVLVRQRVFELLQWAWDLVPEVIQLATLLERPLAERQPIAFGVFAWLAVFEEEDQRTFLKEIREAIVKSLALQSVDAVEELIRDWRTTASALSNEKGRRVLTSVGESLGEFHEVDRPEAVAALRAKRA